MKKRSRPIPIVLVGSREEAEAGNASAGHLAKFIEATPDKCLVETPPASLNKAEIIIIAFDVSEKNSWQRAMYTYWNQRFPETSYHIWPWLSDRSYFTANRIADWAEDAILWA